MTKREKNSKGGMKCVMVMTPEERREAEKAVTDEKGIIRCCYICSNVKREEYGMIRCKHTGVAVEQYHVCERYR